MHSTLANLNFSLSNRGQIIENPHKIMMTTNNDLDNPQYGNKKSSHKHFMDVPLIGKAQGPSSTILTLRALHIFELERLISRNDTTATHLAPCDATYLHEARHRPSLHQCKDHPFPMLSPLSFSRRPWG